MNKQSRKNPILLQKLEEFIETNFLVKDMGSKLFQFIGVSFNTPSFIS
jgi:hypothetical protein